MQVLALEYEDLNLIEDLQPVGWSGIKAAFEYYLKSGFCHPIKVMIDDEIVGLGATIVHHDVAWLGHIIAHADHRGKGIGKCVTQSLVEIAKQNRCETIYLIATQLGFLVYEKLGFITDTEYLVFKELNFDQELQISDQVIPYQQEFKHEIAIIDQIATGEDRMMHLEPFLESGFVYRAKSQILGFYLPSLGDGLIVANDSSAGLALLKMHLKSNEKANFPIDNLFAKDFLYNKGFREYDVVKHMRLGNVRPFKLGHIYNRVSGSIG